MACRGGAVTPAGDVLAPALAPGPQGALPAAAPEPPAQAAVPPEPEPAASAGLAPLRAPAPIASIPIDERRSAVVSFPLGATSPRPLVVATHGAGGRAERQCELWRRLIGDRAFVLCPRGRAAFPRLPPEEGQYYYPGHPALGEEISACIAALHAAYGDYLDPAAPIFSGFSQGAGMGSMILPHHEARFTRAVLIEGGFGEYREWNVAVAPALGAKRGVRVLLLCGRQKCAELGRETARYMRMGGLDARMIHVVGAGHIYGGDMEARLAQELEWLFEGDPRWAP